MANQVIIQRLKGLPAVRAKIKMRQAIKSKPKAKVPEKKDGQDKA